MIATSSLRKTQNEAEWTQNKKITKASSRRSNRLRYWFSISSINAIWLECSYLPIVPWHRFIPLSHVREARVRQSHSLVSHNPPAPPTLRKFIQMTLKECGCLMQQCMKDAAQMIQSPVEHWVSDSVIICQNHMCLSVKNTFWNFCPHRVPVKSAPHITLCSNILKILMQDNRHWLEIGIHAHGDCIHSSGCDNLHKHTQNWNCQSVRHQRSCKWIDSTWRELSIHTFLNINCEIILSCWTKSFECWVHFKASSFLCVENVLRQQINTWPSTGS